MKLRFASLIGTAVLVLLGAYLVSVAAGGDVLDEQGGVETTLVAERQGSEAGTETESADGRSTISVTELPLEALDTLDLIRSGGPYPFNRDDLTFENREGLLPDRPEGHYREYTVITPGSDDRGARRIVTGADGERYYTADHYNSFRTIVFEG